AARTTGRSCPGSARRAAPTPPRRTGPPPRACSGARSPAARQGQPAPGRRLRQRWGSAFRGWPRSDVSFGGGPSILTNVRSRIVQGVELALELLDVLELAVDGREAHVRHAVQQPQVPQRGIADRLDRDLGAQVRAKLRLDGQRDLLDALELH